MEYHSQFKWVKWLGIESTKHGQPVPSAGIVQTNSTVSNHSLWITMYSNLQLSKWTKNYRGPTVVILKSLDEDNICVLCEPSFPCRFLSVKNPGFWGSGSSILLFNIRTTDDISGRYSGYSWTQSNPIWMTRNTSHWLLDSKIAPSINSSSCSPLKHLHA